MVSEVYKEEELPLSTIQYHENQIDTLVEEGVDGLLFETYYDLEELTNIVTTTRRKYDIPIIAQLTASNTNYLVDGTEINKALQRISCLWRQCCWIKLPSRSTPYATLIFTY